MLFWRTTVLPAVKRLAELTGCKDFFICEDNVVLADGVVFAMVVACVQIPASVWGYGNFIRSPGKQHPFWHGILGVYVSVEFCAKLEIMLDNMPLHAYCHIDNWMANRNQSSSTPFIVPSVPCAGYSFCQSLT